MNYYTSFISKVHRENWKYDFDFIDRKVTEMDVGGPIPEDFWTLTYLFNLYGFLNFFDDSFSSHKIQSGVSCL